MKRLLLVIPDDLRRAVLAALAGAEGLEVINTSGSLQALTQLERNPPDLILCDDQLLDLSVQEFCEILRSEETTGRTPLLLITDQPPPWLDPMCDLSASHERTSLELLDLLGARASVNRKYDPFGLGTLTLAADEAQMSGTLELMSLFDLLSSLNQVRQTGRIVLKIGLNQALMYLLGGEILHAEYRGLFGHEALSRTLIATEQAPSSTFSITATPDSLFQQLPPTISVPTSRLLLELAVQLDHLRTWPSRSVLRR